MMRGEYRTTTTRYRVTADDYGDGIFEWTVETLPLDYDGCDGLCTYGCGADPWVTVEYGCADDLDTALHEAGEFLPADAVHYLRPRTAVDDFRDQERASNL